jgi:ubiquinone biosynthesis protein
VERELGRKVHEVFQSVEPVALGAATIGQVHGAVLLNGQRVVIKVQYPEVEQVSSRFVVSSLALAFAQHVLASSSSWRISGRSSSSATFFNRK